MTNKLILSFAAASLVFGSAAIAAPGPIGHKQPTTRAELPAAVAARFAMMDVNKDGVLNQADRQARKAQRFAALDTDRDGAVTLAEMQAAQQRRPTRADHPGKPDRPAPTDAQAKVSKPDRAARMQQMFARLDSDGNGGVTQAEFAAAHQGKGGRPGPRGATGADAGRNGTTTQAEMQARALAMFDRIDTDRNGTISDAERGAARDAMRTRMQQRHAARQQG